MSSTVTIMGDSRTAQEKALDEVEIAARRVKVGELRLHRYTLDEIAETIGTSKSTVGRDLEAVKGEWHARAHADYDGWVAEEVALLDILQRQVLPEALYGRTRKVTDDETGETRHVPTTNLFAVDRVLAIAERRAKLLGLDAPMRVRHEGENDSRTRLDDEIERLSKEHAAAAEAETADGGS